jgi:hypothetical protein
MGKDLLRDPHVECDCCLLLLGLVFFWYLGKAETNFSNQMLRPSLMNGEGITEENMWAGVYAVRLH